MAAIPIRLQQLLDKRKEEHSFRTLKVPEDKVDFCSNDYLGAAKSIDLHRLITAEVSDSDLFNNGSTGSRLLAGNTKYAEELEEFIAGFHHAEAALIFNSGYDANVGLFSSIAGKEDTIICDELIHASIIDGCRMSRAAKYKFRHNDLDDLKQKLSRSKGNIFVAVESVYSMDGDFAPLKELIAVTEQQQAFLIVDEAHATGVFGKEGRGLLNETELEEKIFARIHTFGKALGVHGAAVVGSETLKDFLINYARSFIYSTALPFHSLAAIKCSYEWMKQRENERAKLHQLISFFKNQIPESFSGRLIESNSAVQSVIISGNDNCRNAAGRLQEKGFDIRPILSPTVPEGKERLRICLHTFNTEEEIKSMLNELALLF